MTRRGCLVVMTCWIGDPIKAVIVQPSFLLPFALVSPTFAFLPKKLHTYTGNGILLEKQHHLPRIDAQRQRPRCDEKGPQDKRRHVDQRQTLLGRVLARRVLQREPHHWGVRQPGRSCVFSCSYSCATGFTGEWQATSRPRKGSSSSKRVGTSRFSCSGRLWIRMSMGR